MKKVFEEKQKSRRNRANEDIEERKMKRENICIRERWSSFNFNDTFPPKRNFKVGKFQQRTARHPSLLMKLLPTCTFNFTPSSLFLFLFARLLRFSRGAAQVLSLFFLLLLLPFPLLFLNLLNECSPCITSSPSYNWVHILLVVDPLCVVIVYSLMAARCLSFDEPSPSTRRRIPRHVLSTEILKTPFEPRLSHVLRERGPSKSF